MNKKVLYICIGIAVIMILVACIILIIPKTNTSDSGKNNDSTKSVATSTPANSANKELTEQSKSMFNSKFDYYYGDYVSGTQISQLLATVKASNTNDPLNVIDVTINGKSSIDSNLITKTNTYKVSFKYNVEGLINKIIIEEN